MEYKRICSWCKKAFETDVINQDHCSIECFTEEQDDIIKQMEEEA